MELLELIQAAQGRRGWNDKIFSQMVALKSPSSWSRIKHEQRPLSISFLRGVCSACPELKPQVAAFITEQIKGGERNA